MNTENTNVILPTGSVHCDQNGIVETNGYRVKTGKYSGVLLSEIKNTSWFRYIMEFRCDESSNPSMFELQQAIVSEGLVPPPAKEVTFILRDPMLVRPSPKIEFGKYRGFCIGEVADKQWLGWVLRQEDTSEAMVNLKREIKRSMATYV